MDAFRAALKQAAKSVLNSANLVAELVSLAPEDVETDFYTDTMRLLRDMADKIDPPVEDWPDKVVPLAGRKRRK